MGTIFGGAFTLVAGALLTGCYTPAAPACALLCAEDGACPADLTCNAAGLCAPEGQACAAREEGDADSGVAGCGLLPGPADDFEDDLLDEERWRGYAELGAELREEGGQLVFALAPEREGSQVAGVISREAFPVAGFDARARVLYADEEAALSLTLHAEEGGGSVTLLANPGRLKMLGVDGGHEESDSDPWDPAAQPWWRVRVDEEDIVFAVSEDGAAWERLGEVDADRLGQRVFVELSGFTDTAAATPRRVGFEEIGPHCR